MTLGTALALAGAAMAIILAATGSTIGVVKISSAANAILAKEPKYFSRLLILMLLPSSQSIYALVVSFMTFVNLGIIGGPVAALSTATGLSIFFLCLPVGFVGLISAIMQGNVGVTAVGLFAKRNKLFGSTILIISASEVFALFAFLISMLGILFIDISAYVPVAEAAKSVVNCCCSAVLPVSQIPVS